ncbi:MAG: DUF3127 domain-containing protein [Cytophagaceae bacterium]|nr:DUF3127 domain-containing protein [Cytophagaceae bacterium]
MALEVTGKLIKILNSQSGTGAKGTWVKQEFVIETADQYPKKICCSVWGDKVESLKNLNIGDQIKVSFNIESREYNERWYTDVRAWKLELAGKGSSSKEKTPDEPPMNFESSPEEDDLPF